MLMNRTVLFVFLSIAGCACVTLFLSFLYLNYHLHQNIWRTFFSTNALRNIFGNFLLFGGSTFLTVGIIGIGRQNLRNRKTLFTVFTLVLVPATVSIMVLLIGLLAPLPISF